MDMKFNEIDHDLDLLLKNNINEINNNIKILSSDIEGNKKEIDKLKEILKYYKNYYKKNLM